MTGLGIASDALVNEAIVHRARDGDRIVLATPSRPDFWFGHGYVYDTQPDAARIAATIAAGRTRYGALGAASFVVQWERALDAPEPLATAFDGTSFDRTVMMVYEGPLAQADPRVADHDDAAWSEAAALALAEYPAYEGYTSWRFERVRDDVRRGRARVVGIRDAGSLVATAGLYRGDGIARFWTPVTRPDARGRGLFSACARTLIAWANADRPRRVVIAADAGGGPIALYRRLGFVPASYLEAIVVPLPPHGLCAV